MKLKDLAPLLIVLLSLLLVVQCSENPVQTEQNVKADPAELLKYGKPGETDNKRGDEFGDLYVVLRDINGEPQEVWVMGKMDEMELNPKPVAFVWDGTLVDGEPVLPEDSNFPGEGFPE